MTDNIARCELCGEPMPLGEEMFKYHGFSGNCPKPPLSRPPSPATTGEATVDSRPCTCHPDDNPPVPCAKRYALSECRAVAITRLTAELAEARRVAFEDAVSVLRDRANFLQECGDDPRLVNYGASPSVAGKIKVDILDEMIIALRARAFLSSHPKKETK